MKKLTAEDILDIIRDNFTEHSFAFEEWEEVGGIDIPEYIGEKEAEVRDSFYDAIKVLPRESNEWKEGLEKYKEMPSKWNVKKKWVLDQLGLGEVVEVDQYGGEGQGDDWWSVKHFVDHDVYIKIEGSYASYNGTEFYSGYGYEVKPQEKVVTVFESIK